MTGGNGASLYSSFSNYPPEMFRVSGMPIKIKDQPFKFGTACGLHAFLVTVQ
jgi:hypothetical protein